MFENISNKFIRAKFITKRSYMQNNIGIKGSSIITEFDQKNFLIPNQIHSTNVVLSNSPGIISRCDGVFTTNPKIVCSIKVADCMPIFFAHKNKSVFGIVHAGWKGLTKGILNEVSILLKTYKQNLNDFDIIIGPSIQNCCFEIAKDTVDYFPSKFIQPKGSGKFIVNLQKMAFEILKRIGFNNNNIKINSDCTFCQKSDYYSYRRDGEKAGRMIGLIGYTFK